MTEVADTLVGNGAAADSHVENGSAGKAQELPITFKAVKPMLIYQAPNCAEAIAFYKVAFGAEELHRSNFPKRKAEQEEPHIMHAHLRFGETEVYMSDFTDETAENTRVKPAAALNASTVGLHLDTNNADAAFARAVEAGAAVETEMADQFWGDRYGSVVDPFGLVWSFSTPLSKEAAVAAEAAGAEAGLAV